MARATAQALTRAPPPMPWPSLLPALLLTLATCVSAEPQQQSQHNSNFAVLVSTSRSWRNYRHTANVLAIYRTVKRLGIPDSNILLFMADDHACNPRNPWKANIFRSEDHSLNVYGDDVEVDYRGYEVTIENLLRVLTGRHDPAVPKSKRLLSDQGSNILIFMTGHGGDEFLKFQDVGELLAQDLADALDQMAEKGRYNEVLLIVETCEAHSLTNRITAPRVVTMASSLKGESSYSYRNDFALGQSMTDRFTHQTLEFMERVELSSDASLQDLINSYRYSTMQSHLGTRVLPGIDRPLSEVKLTDFFGGVSPAHVLPQTYPLGPRKTEQQQQQQQQQWQQQRRDAERSAPSLQQQQQQQRQQQQQQVQQQVLHQPSKMDQGSGAQQDWLMVAVGMTLVAAVTTSSWLTGRRQE